MSPAVYRTPGGSSGIARVQDTMPGFGQCQCHTRPDRLPITMQSMPAPSAQVTPVSMQPCTTASWTYTGLRLHRMFRVTADHSVPVLNGVVHTNPAAVHAEPVPVNWPVPIGAETVPDCAQRLCPPVRVTAHAVHPCP